MVSLWAPFAPAIPEGSPLKGPGPASCGCPPRPQGGPWLPRGASLSGSTGAGLTPPPEPPAPGLPTDLVALTQHMALFLPGTGLEAGVLGPGKAMWLRGHGAGLQPASSRRVRPRTARNAACWLRPPIPPAGSCLLHLGPAASRASSPPRTSCCWIAGQPPVASTSCLPPFKGLRPVGAQYSALSALFSLLGFSRAHCGQRPQLSRPRGEASHVPWEEAPLQSLQGQLRVLGFFPANT